MKDQNEQEEEDEQVGLRIRRRLEPNEHIHSIFNCSSVDGLDKIGKIGVEEREGGAKKTNMWVSVFATA